MPRPTCPASVPFHVPFPREPPLTYSIARKCCCGIICQLCVLISELANLDFSYQMLITHSATAFLAACLHVCVCVCAIKNSCRGHILAANELLERAALEAAATLLILLLRLVLCFPKLIVICAICLHTHIPIYKLYCYSICFFTTH